MLLNIVHTRQYIGISSTVFNNLTVPNVTTMKELLTDFQAEQTSTVGL